MNKFRDTKRAKLTDQQVIDILEDRNTDLATQAKKYGVAVDTIRKLFRRESYKHITANFDINRDKVKIIKKIDEDIVRAIRTYQRTDFDEMAKEYGVTTKYLKMLRCPSSLKDQWKHIDIVKPRNYKPPIQYLYNPTKLNREAVIDIYQNRSVSYLDMAVKYKINFRHVQRIRSGGAWANITKELQHVV